MSGLTARPGVDPALVALVAAAVLEVWPHAVTDDALAALELEATERARREWRFGGRSWSRPGAGRRGPREGAARPSRPWSA